ncbi:MAG: S8 family serine peptidase [Bacteriovoracaceae bacterium]|nr:S8 family serine peptidase [Bacteriovoracaceae bacterium]
MKLFLAAMMSLVLSTQAATIAIIDSGVDTEHRDLIEKIWVNPIEIADNGRDEDHNGYQDDVFGWNFAENNNLVIDRKYIGTFSNDPHTFFEIQGRQFLGQTTPEDREWLKAKRQDKEFQKEMSKFGNFVHGTHVAGIAVENNDKAKILSVKLIPTEIKPFVKKTAAPVQRDVTLQYLPESFRMRLLKAALEKLAAQQLTLLEEIAHYVGQHNADIANGSFGTGFPQATKITATIFKIFFFRAPTGAESKEVTTHFLNSMVKQGKHMVNSAKKTLFVFAAGNDGLNNDIYPTSPTNIQADNVISVAATYKYQFIAPFSNYGEKMVDVAAPGMLINSQIPGDEYLPVSGTSQAAPYVANIAAQIKDTNANLTPKQIKEILMGTVDKKKWLTNKVKTNGIVNMNRAVMAAKLTKAMSVKEAIKMSLAKVSDVVVKKTKSRNWARMVKPMPMPSMFR